MLNVLRRLSQFDGAIIEIKIQYQIEIEYLSGLTIIVVLKAAANI